MNRKEALQRIPFLKDLPEEAFDEIAAAGTERVLQKNEVLFAQDSPCLGLIVILRGEIKVYTLNEQGRELTLHIESAGTSIAELPLFDGGPYPAGADGNEDETIVFVVPRQRFLDLMTAYPEIPRRALEMLAARMRQLVQIVESQTRRPVRARLAAFLLRRSSGRPVFALEETNSAIASQIGTVRDVVSRHLHGFQEEGVIRLQKRWVTIEEREALQRIAGSD